MADMMQSAREHEQAAMAAVEKGEMAEATVRATLAQAASNEAIALAIHQLATTAGVERSPRWDL